MKKFFFLFISLLIFSCSSIELTNDYLISSPNTLKLNFEEATKKNWHNLDLERDSVPGMSVERAYQELIKDMKGKKVIVAVIDAGIDTNHEDLNDVIWVNDKEIPNNLIDDDNNGYIDDINGWNFLGESYNETLEMTRIIRDSLINNRRYDSALNNINSKRGVTQRSLDYYNKIVDDYKKSVNDLSNYLGKDDFEQSDVASIKSNDSILLKSKEMITYFNSLNLDLDDLLEGVEYFSDQMNYHYNTSFNGRSIVGDNVYDIKDVSYGNSRVKHSKSSESHGTHVSGIIGGIRNNSIGSNGVNNNLEIMAIRAVPNGDEYDKDIALGIRYAVDNGARIINMSFGKSYSTNPEWVIDAIKYAAKNNVLIVHAAGNETEDLDNNSNENYPNDQYLGKNEFSNNFINVGASTIDFNENIVASFSNFGLNNVDIFAPGYDIYSLMPDNKYDYQSGTSMAAPALTGVASMVLSYFPRLSAAKLKEIILESGIEVNLNVKVSEKGNIPFKSISKTGKLVNAYNALILASRSKRK
ncbi:S8 family peptidase [Flavobacteriaceae bacterium]|jgi:subtilisin family serine protease|nr:S8 family serine peptidase [Cryomorphaceae bacterium]MDB3967630.1 S8 family peptidase [Flavobacteriaceae bacterium]MBT3503068.1 S8 family serine peptidase [Cryomorphaceae bacterium]MBT3689589.1 S8 family serine peptidase [Cryomorphaceae bacterium]MBT4222765.1 S8 family serine peptidase [Cryomorphaceae bacterium]